MRHVQAALTEVLNSDEDMAQMYISDPKKFASLILFPLLAIVPLLTLFLS